MTTTAEDPLTVEDITEAILDAMVLVRGRGWGLEYGILIRDLRGYCPIAALREEVEGKRPRWRCDVTILGRDMHPDISEACGEIALAADGDHFLRPRLLQALGMVSE